MAVSMHTIGVLAQAAAEKIGEFPLWERIKIYQALGESLPGNAERTAANESWDSYAVRMLEHFRSIAARKNELQRRR